MLRWRSGDRQEAVVEETGGVIASACLSFPGHEKRRLWIIIRQLQVVPEGYCHSSAPQASALCNSTELGV